MLIQINDYIALISDKLTNWYKLGVEHVPNIILAILIIVVFSFVSRYARKIIARIMGKLSHNIALGALVSTLTRIAILSIGLFSALSVLGLDKTVTSLLAGAGVVALAIGFAFQDLTANFISGTFITLQRPIQVGDVVETNGFMGKVKSINLRSIIIDNFAGQEIGYWVRSLWWLRNWSFKLKNKPFYRQNSHFMAHKGLKNSTIDYVPSTGN